MQIARSDRAVAGHYDADSSAASSDGVTIFVPRHSLLWIAYMRCLASPSEIPAFLRSENRRSSTISVTIGFVNTVPNRGAS